MTASEPSVLEEVIAHGQRGLCFPAQLEAEFEADTVVARRRLLFICGMVGIAGIWFGAEMLRLLVPESAELTSRTRLFLMGLATLSQCISWVVPANRWKNWHFEFATSMNTMLVGAATLWGTTVTQADGVFTHSAAVIGVVMYAGIAARQRFRWTFASSTLTFIAYCLFVHGNTSVQQLVVQSNTLMLGLGLVLTLLASYGFEFRERRAWLLRRQSMAMQASLVRASEKLRELSVRDPLTGLHNRRHFEAAMTQIFARARSARQSVAMLVLDVDFFKRYNDSHGHPAGDACLKRVAAVLAEVGHAHAGVTGRLGGEEFGMVLAGRSLDEMSAIGQQVCEALSHAGIVHGASPVGPNVTGSVGVAVAWPDRGDSGHALFQMADMALYRAKHQGRDRVVAHEGAVPPSTSEAGVFHENPPAPDAERDADATLLKMSRVLDQGFRWLFFPREIESVYQTQHLNERRRHLITASVLGVLAFNAYTFMSLGMFPDIASVVSSAILTLSACTLGAVGCSFFFSTKAWVRESLYAMGTTVIAAALIHALSRSHAFTVYVYAVALFLIPMFACVVARQPFWFALVPSLGTIACLGFFKPVSPLEQLVMQDSTIIVVNATLYTLIAAYTLERGARKEWLLNEISLRQRQQLESTTRHLRQLAVSDPLTGISNRRQFEADLARVWAACASQGRDVAMLIMDVDFFKPFNDHHGHPAGDACLRRVASVLSEVAAKERGLVARLGGEEFGIVLPDRTLAQAADVGQRVCDAVREAGIAHGFSSVSPCVSVSVGAASMPADEGMGTRGLLSAADGALYRAKAGGRDRVATALAVHRSVSESVSLVG